VVINRLLEVAVGAIFAGDFIDDLLPLYLGASCYLLPKTCLPVPFLAE
jgi:hypothetical protein